MQLEGKRQHLLQRKTILKKKNEQEGSVFIETDPDKVAFLKETKGWSVSGHLWPEVKKNMNMASQNMKAYLSKTFGVTEFHPMSDQFTTLEEPKILCQILERVFTNTDNNLFKSKEKRQKNRFRKYKTGVRKRQTNNGNIVCSSAQQDGDYPPTRKTYQQRSAKQGKT